MIYLGASPRQDKNRLALGWRDTRLVEPASEELSSATLRMGTSRSDILRLLCCIAPWVLVSSSFGQPLTSSNSPAPPSPEAESLKSKTDTELLEFVLGPWGAGERYVSDENVGDLAKPSPLDSLWEMPPQAAALALAAQFVDERSEDVQFEIDEPGAKPPTAGEIGLRWINGNHYAARAEGVTILKYDGYDSRLLLSEVELEGNPSKSEIEGAVMKTDVHPLPRLVAQQTYEILWWLRHVRRANQPESYSSATWSSVDDFGRFWMKPHGPTLQHANFGEPCGHCLNSNAHPEAYAAFADTLLRRVIRRSGIKRRYPVPVVGKHIDPDDDAKFLHTRRPDPHDSEAQSRWIGRLVQILRNPKRQYLYSSVMEMLVPISDPLRYRDERIDDALLGLLRRGLAAAAEVESLPELPDVDWSNIRDPAEFEKAEKASKKKRDERRAEERRLNELKYAGISAAEKLGMHDAVGSFAELFELGKQRKVPLAAAANIAGRHPEVRATLAHHLKEHLSLQEAWRADLRDLAPEVAKFGNPPEKPATAESEPDTARRERHKAAVLLATWNEPDRLTKTKLDTMLLGYIGNATSVPEVLRAEFAALSGEDQLKVRNFVTWMRTVNVPWSRRYIENAFTPHTPRPDIAFER